MKDSIRRLFLVLFVGMLFCYLPAQNIQVRPPDYVYGSLFTQVQMQKIYPDSKTFADAFSKTEPEKIVKAYNLKKDSLGFSLQYFVSRYFILPIDAGVTYKMNKHEDLAGHIRNLWEVLKRSPDKDTLRSSLLPLPYSYIVPGGRFREIYYWDSYFTMLGLKENGETGLIKDMVDNFAYLIRTYGHIPNGNRSYYLSRSQPPFFSLMVDLLASIEGDSIFLTYADALQEEYDYWMDRTGVTAHVVKMKNGEILNRYWDQLDIPRQESFREDSLLMKSSGYRPGFYRDIRSGAESGWDFSSRWLSDGHHLATIRTTDLIPVDLNCLLYHLERTLAHCYSLSGEKEKKEKMEHAAARRLYAINHYLYDAVEEWYGDYVISTGKLSQEWTLAGMMPFFLEVAPAQIAKEAFSFLKKNFLKPGGVVTSLRCTGQQWDAPNGWAPLQWITIEGLSNYGYTVLAGEIAGRWLRLNEKVYKVTGKLMEKYNVEDMNLPAGGGEYATQDGFGWTNGVYLALLKKYQER